MKEKEEEIGFMMNQLDEKEKENLKVLEKKMKIFKELDNKK